MRVKNWETFQHFKDRRPPWIKLYREILDQRDIMMISDRYFRVLILLWLIASEDKTLEGNLPPVSDIAWRLRMDEDELLTIIKALSPWIDSDDINVISSRYQSDTPETETETETETDIRDIVPEKPEPTSPMAKWFEEFWSQYPKRNGKRIGRKDAYSKYKTIVRGSESRRAEVLLATRCYSRDCGDLPKDAHRWLSQDRWREWIPKPEPPLPIKHVDPFEK